VVVGEAAANPIRVFFLEYSRASKVLAAKIASAKIDIHQLANMRL
jgi:hypothetical protein